MIDFDGFKGVVASIGSEDDDFVEQKENVNKQNSNVIDFVKKNKQNSNVIDFVKKVNIDYNSKRNDDLLRQISNEINNNKQIKNNYVEKKDKKNNVASGHRQRARERFLLNTSGVSDYDLLELILFLIIPRVDTKPMARILIERFKTIRNIFQASKDDLNACGVNGDALKYIFILFQTLQSRLISQQMKEKSIFDNIETLVKYCQLNIGFLKEEEFHILFFNNKFNLLKDENFGVSGVDGVMFSQREIIKMTLQIGANNVVLCHNHPSGDIKPSQNDVNMTNKIIEALRTINVEVIDHLIVSGEQYFSFYEHEILLSK